MDKQPRSTRPWKLARTGFITGTPLLLLAGLPLVPASSADIVKALDLAGDPDIPFLGTALSTAAGGENTIKCSDGPWGEPWHMIPGQNPNSAAELLWNKRGKMLVNWQMASVNPAHEITWDDYTFQTAGGDSDDSSVQHQRYPAPSGDCALMGLFNGDRVELKLNGGVYGESPEYEGCTLEVETKGSVGFTIGGGIGIKQVVRGLLWGELKSEVELGVKGRCQNDVQNDNELLIGWLSGMMNLEYDIPCSDLHPVRIYEHAGAAGACRSYALPEGTDTLEVHSFYEELAADGNRRLWLNHDGLDHLSSVRATDGIGVLLYEHVEFGGRCLAIHGEAELWTFELEPGLSWNDQASSMKVARGDPKCSGSVVADLT